MGLRRAFPETATGLPLGALLIALALTGVVTVSAALLPSLPALRRPTPAVLARLVAAT